MQFCLSTLLLLFVVLWSSLAVFGLGGLLVFFPILALAIGIARSWAAFGWCAALATLMVIFTFAVVLPVRNEFRFAQQARRCECINHLKQISLALRQYETANGCYPPAFVAGKNGHPRIAGEF